jgi:hypothetical protein
VIFPRSSSVVDRVAQVLALVACVWFAFCASWGLFQIPGGGHTDSGSVGTVAFSLAIAKFHILYPSDQWFTATPPPPSSYFCHHPFGIFYVSALFLWLFGNHDFVIHLPAAVMSAATPPLLYGIGARYRGPVVGAVTACSFVVVPIAIGFSNYTNLEVLGIFGSVLFFWGHTAHQQTKRWGHLAASLFGLALACSADWCGYALVAPLVGWSFFRAFILPARWTPRFDFKPYATWWALSVTIAVGTFFLWIALFYKADKIGDWLSSGVTRGGDGSPLEVVLASRKNWIDFSFTPLAIGLGKLAAPVALLRFLWVRRDEEAYSLSILLGAVFEYVVFKRGADVHIFWPHYFAEYFALGMAQLAMTAGDVASLTTRWRAPRDRARSSSAAVGSAAALVVGVMPVLAMTPDAVRCLDVWRRTGGRYDDKGALIRSDIDLTFVLENVIAKNQPEGAILDTGPALSLFWEHAWALRGGARATGDPVANQPRRNDERFWAARASALSSGDQLRIAGEAHVRAYGDIWVVDQRQAPMPMEAWTVIERNPNPFEWLALGNWEPVRKLGTGPDVLRTWEWRVHLNQTGETPPALEVTALDDVRIQHNAAVYAGDTARAEALRETIERRIDRTVETAFDQGVRLMGVRLDRGAPERVEVWFVTSQRLRADVTFRVRSTIEAPAAFSLIPVDPTDREMAYPPRIPTKLWRPGFIYKVDVVLNHRIGVERYFGMWSAGGPVRLDGRPDTTLVTLR